MATENLSLYYGRMARKMRKHSYAHFAEDNIFQCHIVAAYSKALQFNLLVNKKSASKNAYFYTPSLRGICEDLISLKFFKKHKSLNSNKILLNYTYIELADNVKTQVEFFRKNHNQQIVFSLPDTDEITSKNTIEIKKEWSVIGLNKDRIFPTVQHMAIDASLSELYNYLYSATSSMVHFSPHILMRSGWNKEKESRLYHFSMSNFDGYYTQFNRFYGTYLFVLFVKSFKRELGISKVELKMVVELEEELYMDSRWPELVTFEEMNHPQAESIRIINLLRKIRNVKKDVY